MGLHRVSLLPLGESDGEPTALVLVAFTTPFADGQSLRARLQAVLGRQLRGYSLAFDVPRHTAKGTLYILRRDLESAKRCLASGLPQLEIGCAASGSCAGGAFMSLNDCSAQRCQTIEAGFVRSALRGMGPERVRHG